MTKNFWDTPVDGLNDLKAFIVYITDFLKKEGYTHNG